MKLLFYSPEKHLFGSQPSDLAYHRNLNTISGNKRAQVSITFMLRVVFDCPINLSRSYVYLRLCSFILFKWLLIYHFSYLDLALIRFKLGTFVYGYSHIYWLQLFSLFNFPLRHVFITDCVHLVSLALPKLWTFLFQVRKLITYLLVKFVIVFPSNHMIFRLFLGLQIRARLQVIRLLLMSRKLVTSAFEIFVSCSVPWIHLAIGFIFA